MSKASFGPALPRSHAHTPQNAQHGELNCLWLPATRVRRSACLQNALCTEARAPVSNTRLLHSTRSRILDAVSALAACHAHPRLRACRRKQNWAGDHLRTTQLQRAEQPHVL